MTPASRGPEGALARLVALIDASPVPVIAFDRDGIVTLWSRAAEQVFGWTEAEVVGRPLPIVPDDKQAEFASVREAVMRGRTFAGFETHRRRKDGATVLVSFSNAGVRGPSGEIDEIVAIVEDVTERRQAARALQEHGERLRQTLEATRTGSWEWAIATNEVVWSDTMGPQYGLPPGSVVPTYEAVLDRVHPDDRATFAAAVAQAVEEGRDYALELRVVWPDGSIHWLAAQAHVQLDDNGRPARLLGLSRDITEQKQLEADVRESHETSMTARREADTLGQRLADVQSVIDVALAHTSVDELLSALLERVHSALEADTTTIFLLDEEQRFERRATHGSEEELTMRVLNTVGQSLVHRTVERHTPIVLEDASGLADIVSEARGIRSVAGVPLLVEGRIIGVLCVGHLETSVFARDDIRLLQLVADRAALAIENARLYEHKHTVAETLQRSLIQKRLPWLPGATLAARYLAAGAGLDVGGDWYDASELPDGRLALVIGDVVGHGIDAAATMGQIRNALRAYALEGHGPAAALDRLNRLVLAVEDGEMTTLVFLVFDPAAGSVRFASAGHPPPLVVHPDGRAAYLDGGRSVPLGIFPDASYVEAEATLEPGATVLLYTDGLVERRSASLDHGMARLVVAAGEAEGDVEALLDHLVRELLAVEGPNDDVALLALRLAFVASERLQLRFRADPAMLASLRAALAGFLAPAEMGEDEAYAITVACGEAAANAIEHAYVNGKGHFEIDAWRSDREIEIVVRDSGGWRVSQEELGRGFGLLIIEALMDSVEIRRGERGTEVRMRRRLRAVASS